MDAADKRFRRIVAILGDVAPRSPQQVGPETHLAKDFHLDAADLLSAAELIEQEYSITLGAYDLLNVALNAPTVAGLCGLVEDVLADG
jgi:acyl carrier protein